MYAVIKTGGKQYRVTPGDVLKVETLQAEVGASVNFEEVLMISDDGKLTVGSPLVASAKVAATVIAHGRAKKVEIIKFKRRKHHQKRTGHRQNFTQVQIQNINGKGKPENVMAPKTEEALAEAKAASEAAAKSTAKKTTKPATAKAKPAAKKAAPKAKATEKKADAKPATKKSSAKDDLTKIEGIGPKAAEALTAAGLATFADVSKSTPTKIKKILDEAEGKFGAMDPGTWTKQAKMAATDKWDELKKWQDEMDGGIEK
ncbi:MAG TPA: 50S ribosomal protein L21 [Leucothrix sp.]|nr:50S ribosomal protein L21 [Leucothrix sp.]